MVLAAIIPTAAGAVWHGQRGFAAFTGVAASKKSSRLAVKYSAGQDDGSVGRETPAVAAPSGAQQLSLNGLASIPATATSKRGKFALDKGKRKREDIGAAERPPLMLSEQKTPKDKKDHDKYCHFCQHVKVNMMACESEGCTHRFCTYCLQVHLGVDTDHSRSETGGWRCPTCSSGCCCSQTECNKAHRHCKAFRYRARRAAAASLRMSAAHALVSLGVSPPKGKAMHPIVAGVCVAQKNFQMRVLKETAPHVPPCERPAKRRESPLPSGPSEGHVESDRIHWVGGVCEDLDPSTSQAEMYAGETAVSVLASLCVRRGSCSPVLRPCESASEPQETSSEHAELQVDSDSNDDANDDAIDEGFAQVSTCRLEQLALCALQSLAATPPMHVPRSPSDGEDILDTPRTVVAATRNEACAAECDGGRSRSPALSLKIKPIVISTLC